MEQYWQQGLEYFKAILRFDLTSIIDIMIVALVFYMLIKLIRGTRAVQLIKGLVILIVATSLTSIFNLYTINWLLKQAMTALVVALPIVFQPELRRGLEKLGRGSIFTPAFSPGTMEKEEQEKLISAVAHTAGYFSKKKIGALIVIERETGLEEFVDTGIKIDGVLTSEFLVNAFFPNTPFHDGAVILRGNRVVAATCFLPLSENPDIPGDLGTRHRAALGISETSDAVTVVVSEETGIISLAVEGVLTRDLDETLLREKLAQLLSNKPGRSLFTLLFGREQ